MINGAGHAINIKRTNSNNPDFKALVVLLNQELHQRNGTIQLDYDQHNLLDFIETVVIAYADNAPAGCGCFKKFDEVTVEIKRMFVPDLYRSRGIASAILTELEQFATELGFTKAVLETGTRRFEAINLYQKLGYVITPNYEPYVDMADSVCMAKRLG
jgi:putative acetyltransferase